MIRFALEVVFTLKVNDAELEQPPALVTSTLTIAPSVKLTAGVAKEASNVLEVTPEYCAIPLT